MKVIETSTTSVPTGSASSVTGSAIDIVTLLKEVENIPCDRESIPQENLDLANKFRTSILPWRGQFSPELVELLLKQYGQDTSVILDPFVGSGTTLFEAARIGLTCYAAEINPSAIEMAGTAHFVSLSLAERKSVIQMAVSIAEEHIYPFTWDLFSYQHNELPPQQSCDDLIVTSFNAMLQQAESHPLVCNLLTNAVIRYMNYPPPRKETYFLRALQEHANIVKSLPFSKRACRVFHTDARAVSLPDASVDLIITSPPYINVFNYHQNNRPAMELMGWDLLNIARSEIGSNSEKPPESLSDCCAVYIRYAGCVKGNAATPPSKWASNYRGRKRIKCKELAF